MPGLLDIAPATITVVVGQNALAVSGLSIAQLRDLLQRFPQAAGLLGKGLDVGLLMSLGPEVVTCVIAMACGAAGQVEAEAVAGQMVAGVQAEILSAAITLTMPKGPKVFLQLLEAAGLDIKGILSAAPLPPPSKG